MIKLTTAGGGAAAAELAICNGRLTLESGVPVPTTNQAAKTTVYFTPYKGNRVYLYNGSTWVQHALTEKSVAVPATTVTPFDVFVYDNAGTLTLQTVNWTNDTTRATALTTQDGVYVKTGATTHLYLGTGRTTGVNGQCEDSLLKRFLWNYYNRESRKCVNNTLNSHTYNGTARYWDNNSGYKFEIVLGFYDTLFCFVVGWTKESSDSGSTCYIALGFDSSSSIVAMSMVGNYGNHFSRAGTAFLADFVLGYHYIALLEVGGAATSTFSSTTSFGVNVLG